MKNRLMSQILAIFLLFGACGSSFADGSIPIWTDPVNPYLAGSINNDPLWIYQKWGIVFSVPNDKTIVNSVTFGLDIRDYVYAPGDGSRSLQLKLFSWSPTLMQTQGTVIFESIPLYKADLWGVADAWGSQKGNIDLDIPVVAGDQYFAQLIGNGFVPFDNGPTNGQLVLNQDGRGWMNIPMSVTSEFKFGNISAVPEPSTFSLMLASLSALGLLVRVRKTRKA